jgi:hypothetical protein
LVYYVVVSQKEHPPVWGWKIQRRSKPMGVQLQGGGFTSEIAARRAGDEALRAFFNALAREHNQALANQIDAHSTGGVFGGK